jgi:N-methylhydantoinase B/oxoprolinase/acetone carboxylase alpha subunit
MSTPKISIGIQPAPLGDVLSEGFEVESRRLVQLHSAAPDMLEALKEISRISIYEIGDFRAVASRMQKRALAAVDKVEGKGTPEEDIRTRDATRNASAALNDPWGKV